MCSPWRVFTVPGMSAWVHLPRHKCMCSSSQALLHMLIFPGINARAHLDMCSPFQAWVQGASPASACMLTRTQSWSWKHDQFISVIAQHGSAARLVHLKTQAVVQFLDIIHYITQQGQGDDYTVHSLTLLYNSLTIPEHALPDQWPVCWGKLCFPFSCDFPGLPSTFFWKFLILAASTLKRNILLLCSKVVGEALHECRKRFHYQMVAYLSNRATFLAQKPIDDLRQSLLRDSGKAAYVSWRR